MSIDTMIEWLKRTEVPLTSISKKTNISRKTLYNWINGGVVRPRSYQKVYDAYKDQINLINTNITTEGNHNMEAQYIIDLQRDKIEQLEATILKHRETPIQNTVWENVEYDYKVKLSLSFKNFKMGRTVLKLDNIQRMAEVLGYSIEEIEEFWDVGTLYEDFHSHPVDKILTQDTLDEIRIKCKTLPTIFEALKEMMGNHHIPTTVTYIRKDKSLVNSIVYNKVDWRNKIVESKVQFLLNN